MEGSESGPDQEFFEQVSRELRHGVVAAAPGWVLEQVTRIHRAWSGSVPDEVAAAARRAGEQAAADLAVALEAAMEGDGANPLAVIRLVLVPHPTRVLEEQGIPPIERDDFERRSFPRDHYGLAPASFADLDPELGELGLMWGAAKAKIHLKRRREIDGS